MSFWTDIRDTVQSVASVVGNYYLPGSGLITSNLVSKGSQEQLGSGVGKIAMIGSGLYGGLPTDMGGAGKMENYGKIFDAAGNFLTGTESSAQQFINADIKQLIDQGFTQEQAASIAQRIATGNASFSAAPVDGAPATRPGGTTDWSKYLTSPSVLGSVISGGAGLLGAGLQANAARQAAQGIADANITSNQLLARMNEQNQARQEPFYQAGLGALPPYIEGIRGTREQQAAGLPGDLVRPFSLKDFIEDPSQEYRTRMGLKAITNSRVAEGLGRSGATYNALLKAGQDYATLGYRDRENAFYANQATRRGALGNLAGFAPPASAAIQSGDTAYGSNAANLASNTAVTNAGAGATRGTTLGNAFVGIGQNIYNRMNPDPMNAMMAAWIQNQIAKG